MPQADVKINFIYDSANGLISTVNAATGAILRTANASAEVAKNLQKAHEQAERLRDVSALRGELGLNSNRAHQVVQAARESQVLKAELQKMGYDQSGNRLKSGVSRIAEEMGFGKQLEGIKGLMGGGVGLAGGSAALAIAAARMAVNAGNDISETYRNPYTPGAYRNEQQNMILASQLRMSDTLQGAQKFYRNTWQNLQGKSGDIERLAGNQRLWDMANVVHQNRSQIQNAEMTLGSQDASKQLRGKEFTSLNLPGLDKSIDRNTAAGQKLYEEQMRILPIVQERAIAEKEQAYRAKDLSRLQERQKGLAREVVSAQDAYRKATEDAAKAERDPSMWGDRKVRSDAARMRQEAAAKRIERAETAFRQGEEQLVEGRKARNEAQNRVAMLGVSVAQQKYETAKMREHEATQVITTAGASSKTEFMRDMINLRIYKQLGAENAPPEAIAAAHKYVPDIANQEDKKVGQQRAGQITEIFPEAAGTKGTLKEKQDVTDARYEEFVKARQKAVMDEADRGGKEMAGMVAEIVKSFRRELQEQIHGIERREIHRQNQGGP